MSNLDSYNEAFITALGADADELGDAFTFEGVEKWDSIAHLQLISELEDAFDVMFEVEDILHFESYNNGIKILERYGIEF